jgi:hypothetical protein
VRCGYRSLNPPRGFLARRAGHRAQRQWQNTKAPTSTGEEYFDA